MATTKTRISVKEGRLIMDFPPSDKEKTSIEFDPKTNKLMVDTLPCAIDISHKDGKFTIRPKGTSWEILKRPAVKKRWER
jgi:hypothetical protein